MISPYVVAASLACHLDAYAAGIVGYLMPATDVAIQRRMGANIFSCAGVSVGITSVQATPIPPNCPPEARYGVDIGIARTCAVEFNKYGQTLNPEADIISQTMSLDGAALWEAFSSVAPLITFQITGGLSIVTATFTVGEFDVPMCAYPQTAVVMLEDSSVFA
jgi:hypothetical protein